ncbi:MAG: hypothetical protein JKY94_00995 [Rhodobacteraceae bacterium]|nr:hypothetical protein [Paracoccaceae bacterium]
MLAKNTKRNVVASVLNPVVQAPIRGFTHSIGNPWWLHEFAGATRAVDYQRGLFMSEGKAVSVQDFETESRNSPATILTRSGQKFSVEPLRSPIGPGVGLQPWQAGTNKCANYNGAPTDLTGVLLAGDAAATLTLYDDETKLREAGFGWLIDDGKMNGYVYKIDNTAGVTSARIGHSGAIGATGDITFSAVVRGSGTHTFHSGFAVGPDNPLTDDYQRVVWTDTVGTGGAGRVFYGGFIGAGEVLYIILNQMETGLIASPEIIVSGASATRLASKIKAVNGTGGLPFPGFVQGQGTMLVEFDPDAMSERENFFRFTDFTGTAGNDLRMLFSGAVIYAHMANGGVSQGYTVSKPWPSGSNARAVMAWETARTALTIGDVAPSENGSMSVPALSDNHTGSDASALYHANGPIKKLAYFPYPMDNTQMRALAAIPAA